MSNSSFEDSLRKERNEIWSRCAKDSLEFSRPPQAICQEWSQAADELLAKAFQQFFGLQDFALFALGKLGSEELNLSSDVDLLILKRQPEIELGNRLRNFQKALHDRTSQGFVFRLDFDLRPGGRSSPVVQSLDQFVNYYGYYGETWERLALVRLRPLCGNRQLIQETMAFARKFSFRRHLDFTLLDDLKNLRQQIQTHHWERTQGEDFINLKLGIGGIRDVELFVHSLQIIHGGKDVSLQIRSTTSALELLGRKSLLPTQEAEFLKSHYWKLRGLENYVQAQADEQTHLLSGTVHPPAIVEKIATLKDEMAHCQDIVKTLLGEPPPLQADPLHEQSFADPQLRELWSEIWGQEVLSQNKGRDERARKAFLTEFLHQLQNQGGDLRQGLLLLKDFIHSTRAKASFFSLLLRERSLRERLSWLFGHSPYLSRLLCQRPELLDSFVYQSQDQHSEDLPQLLEELAEKRLLSELIAGSEFLENREIPQLLDRLTSTADSICLTLLQRLKQDFPSQLQFLALGKWGGKELGFRSDLDFIFVTPDSPNEQDYKLARRLLSRLTETHRGGSIYSVDMRLRPSGNAGPLVISRKNLEEYLKKAPAWERQAYLKARWIDDDQPAPGKCYIHNGLDAKDLEELRHIRQQLLSSPSTWDLKRSAGGLMDIELAAQSFLLVKKQWPSQTSTLEFLSEMGPPAETLHKNYARLRQLEQLLHLLSLQGSSEVNQNDESFQHLASSLQKTPAALWEDIQELFITNDQLLKKLDPRRASH